MNNIEMEDVLPYVESTPRSRSGEDYDAEKECDPKSCSEVCSLDDPGGIISQHEPDNKKPKTKLIMRNHDDVTQQDLDDMKQMVHDMMRLRHLVIQPDDLHQQDLNVMNGLVHHTIRSPDLLRRNTIPDFIDLPPGSSTINDDNDDDILQDPDITASDLQQMVLDIRCGSPTAFVDHCTHSLITTMNFLAPSGAVYVHASKGENESPLTLYDVVRQGQSTFLGLRPSNAATLSSTDSRLPNDNMLSQRTAECPLTSSYC